MLTPGKARGLQATATERGVFNILALDHRQNLRRLLSPDHPEAASFSEMREFKRTVASEIGVSASAVLLDPEIGLAGTLGSAALSGHVGLIVALEETGFRGEPHDRRSNLLAGWSVEKARRIGASAVKLLVYYHPEAVGTSAQEQLVANVVETCRAWDLPLFVEALSFSTIPGQKRVEVDRHLDTLVGIAARLSRLGADVLKLEFPVHPDDDRGRDAWLEACTALTSASQVPWLLLSAAVEFEQFSEQVSVACGAGASGAMSGRAIWKEAVSVGPDERMSFLSTTARQRMVRLASIIDAAARPWFVTLDPPGDQPEGWHRGY
ncbi:tagatose 1,6-diphosphate aldolase [soil metagenome]